MGSRKEKQKDSNAMSYYPEYFVWINMKTRCYNKNVKEYANYGGRGIVVCDEWKNSFVDFLVDMGRIPKKNGMRYSLDRIDVNKNYCFENCRWATDEEQANNKRNNNLITLNEKTQTLQMWSKEVGISEKTIRSRLKLGWTIEKTLSTPVKSVKYNGPHLIEFNSETHNITEWAKITGIARNVISQRIFKGWSIEKILTTPTAKRKKTK